MCMASGLERHFAKWDPFRSNTTHAVLKNSMTKQKYRVCVYLDQAPKQGVYLAGYDSAYIPEFWDCCFQSLLIKILKVFFEMPIL